MRKIDEWGRVVIDPDEAFGLVHRGIDIWSVDFNPGELIDQYNRTCVEWGKKDHALRCVEPLPRTPEEEHRIRSSTWLFPDELKDVDVEELLLSMCRTDKERERITEEMVLYRERGLEPVLRLMIHLIDTFRQNKIVWGVGRGSSVSSYALYLIGVHKIDSIRFGLNIREFLK